MRDLAGHGLRANTISKYAAAVKRFRDFIDRAVVVALILPLQVCAYAVFCQMRGMGASTPRAVWAGLQREDLMSAFDDGPGLDFGTDRQQKLVDATLDGLEQIGSKHPLFRRPLTWEAVDAVVDMAEKSPQRTFGKGANAVTAEMLCAMLLVALQGLFRASEYLSATCKKRSPRALSWGRVRFEGSGDCETAVTSLIDTKTEAKVDVTIDPHTTGKYNAVRRLKAIRRLVDDETAADTAVFRTARFAPLRPNVAIEALRELWGAAGVDCTGFMLHSIRSFGTILLCLAGCTVDQVRLRGRWSTTSSTWQIYAMRKNIGGHNVLSAATAVQPRIAKQSASGTPTIEDDAAAATTAPGPAQARPSVIGAALADVSRASGDNPITVVAGMHEASAWATLVCTDTHEGFEHSG